MEPNKRKALFRILSELGLKTEEDRHNLISGFTNGRTTSTKDLSDWEAESLIKHLESADYKACDKMRKKIISMAIEMGWIVMRNNKPSGDMNAIEQWCLNRSYLKKGLNEYTYKELPKLVTQFSMMHVDHLKR